MGKYYKGDNSSPQSRLFVQEVELPPWSYPAITLMTCELAVVFHEPVWPSGKALGW